MANLNEVKDRINETVNREESKGNYWALIETHILKDVLELMTEQEKRIKELTDSRG